MSNPIVEISGRKPLPKNRLQGIYYTPRPISQIIADWAVRDSDEAILEPSFGGCVFLESAVRRLKQLNIKHPVTRLFGCDQDLEAFDFLHGIDGHRAANFLRGDFISLTRNDFGGRAFDAVIGNPPYISLHNMSISQRKAAAALPLTTPLVLDHKASLWAYFVAHSVSFLKKKGRLGFVLPSSLIHSIYGRQLLDGLSKIFRRCAIISIAEQCFESQKVKERVVLLLADGAFEVDKSSKVDLWGVNEVAEVRSTLLRWDDKSLIPQSVNGHVVPQLLSEKCNDLSHALTESVDMRMLGEFAVIKIGMVTGANHFFVLSQSETIRLNLPTRLLKPLLSKLSVGPGLFLVEQDFLNAQKKHIRTLLFSCSEQETNKETLAYLDTFPLEDRAANKTFLKRACWSRPDEGVIPDAFLTYMVKDGPRIVFNSCLSNSTNTIHRMYFKPEVLDTTRYLLSMSLLSSYAQLSAEFECRAYGSGVLKLEPSEAARIRVPILPEISDKKTIKLARSVDLMLRAGQRQKAVDTVDALIVKELPQLESSVPLNKVRIALKESRARRTYKLSV